ncbi:YcaO-like family protein [Cellulomonas chengniuliangii]|uniref:YcaO-like family protein n=1 Tax=Cellulomonas chengniuliangii TaxID=2968084 RepID=A0ABY5L7G0_9CELL|nr:YcaO-like family protein [Cellulomonas chengniuliangii]MCC2308129.1 YcaO-like family protein [Cellulomonas chengniuliangii]MCC2317137.1 YcaO-like family protein [Cellulomonas chengniuliangii]UUI76523.1 YcaO-like family protein [Cellulomonas chengniuliangii]
MLDLMAALGTERGVARASAVRRPDDLPLWLVGVDVGLSDAREAAGGVRTPFDAVGAYGWTRTDAMRRGVGEAVERYSLIAPVDDPLVAADPSPSDADETVDALVGANVLGPGTPRDGLRWGRAVELTPDGPVDRALPTALLTDPLPEVPWADGSPSGAAAGPGWAFAAERALRESVERDASICAWALRPRLPFVDTLDAVRLTGALDADALLDAAEYLERHTVRAVTVVVPTDVHPVVSALTFVIGRAGTIPVVATGARASTEVAECIAVSLREALQVHASLLPLPEMGRPAPPGAPAVDEPTRAWACMSADAVEHVEGWIAKAGVVPARDLDLRPGGGPLRVDQLAAALRGAGLRPLVADLSPRLPDPFRADGWASVRALVLGHQQYRMDDTKLWSWCPQRLERWASWLHDVDAVDPTMLSHSLI